MLANLTASRICEHYDAYYFSGYFKFREFMNNLMSYDPDLVRLLIVDTKGKILFNSDDLKKSHFIPQPDTPTHSLTDAFELASVVKLETSLRLITIGDGDRGLEVVAPYIQEWGRHDRSVMMTFSYRYVDQQRRVILMMISRYAALGICMTTILAWIIAGRLSRGLNA